MDDMQRIMAKVVRGADDECWRWAAGCTSEGAPKVGFRGRAMSARRAVWILLHGDPGDLCVVTSCGDEKCMNPAHLKTSRGHWGGRRRASLMSSFWSRVSKPNGEDGCWEWTGSRKPSGYGGFALRGQWEAAHRASWKIHRGDIPDGLHVLHRCDNRRCVNPSHLFLGTHEDNMADCVAKGRTVRGERKPSAKLTEDDVRAIRSAYVPWKNGVYRLAAEYGVSPGTVTAIVKRRKWAHVS